MNVFRINLTFIRLKQGGELSWTNVDYDVNTNLTTRISGRSISNGTNFEGRIVGGIAHNIKEFPFFASLKRYGFHTCGGSILTKQYIISAAHCFEQGRPYDWTAVLGISERRQEWSEQSFASRVDAIIVHKDFDSSTLVNDIALLRLENSIPKQGCTFCNF